MRSGRALGRFSLAVGAERWGSERSWIAVLFHHLTDERAWYADDPYVAGLGVSMPVQVFEHRIDSLAKRYDIVGFDEVAGDNPSTGDRAPIGPRQRKRLLLCFDDAYASVARLAGPVLAERGLPWCFFVNPGLVGNRRLAIDNLVTYIANTHGTDGLSEFFDAEVGTVHDVLRGMLPAYGPDDRRRLVAELAEQFALDPDRMVREAGLYVEPEEIRALADAGVEIGNHTTDHVHCRALDATTVEEQVVASAGLIREMTGRPVRGFAYPYGAQADATALVTEALKRSGHTCAFLVQARGNSKRTDRYRRFRITLRGSDDVENACELEVMPRLRLLRARLGAARATG